MVLFKFCKYPLGILNTKSLLNGKIIIESQIPFRVFVVSYPKLFGIFQDRGIFAKVESSKTDGMHVFFIVL